MNLLILFYIMIAGTFSGTFAIPMKYAKDWKWENNWLVWALMATLLIPLTIAFITIPNILDIYIATPPMTLWTIFLFGACWGLGAIFFGLGLELLGIGLGMAIMMGLINSLGTLLPIFIRDPSVFSTRYGKMMLLATFIFIVGISLCATAGAIRWNNQQHTGNGVKSRNYLKGILIAILAGILGPMINFAFVAGIKMQDMVFTANPGTLFAANVVWAIALPGGFAIILAYCLFLLFKNNNWCLFRKVKPVNWIISILPGLLWFGSIMFYGIAANKLGKTTGASTGWALFQALAIISGNVAGIVIGEWKGAGAKAFVLNTIGIVCLIFGIIITSTI